MEKRLILIDSNSLLNKAYFAIKTPLSTEDGRPTNAVYGFMLMLLKILKDYNPTHIVAAFDVREPTFRKGMYDAYKAGRKPMDESLAVQFPMLKQLLKNLGIAMVESPGYEADDIIGTLSKKCDYDTYIFTGDKDSLQLVSDSTTVIYAKQGIQDIIVYTPARLLEDGFRPEQIIDYKALRGDASDNIPGVRGVGEKTAMQLLSEYDSLDGVYDNIESIKGATKDKLINNKELAFLSYQLATIKTDMDLNYAENECNFSYPFDVKAKQYMQELGFKSLIAKLEFQGKEEQDEVKKAEINICEVRSQQDLDKMHNAIRVAGYCAIHKAADYRIAVDCSSEWVLKAKANLIETGLDYAAIERCVHSIYEDAAIKKLVYDAKTLMYECAIVNYDDLSVKAYLVDAGKNYKGILSLFSAYGVEESAVEMIYINNKIDEELDKFNMRELYLDMEKPLIKVLYDMERAGIAVDVSVLEQLKIKFSDELQQVTAQIIDIAGENFNINSTQQLSHILFDVLGLSHGKKNKTGKYSTNVDVLEALRGQHEIVEHILRYREISKLLSTYINGVEPMLVDGRLHCIFNQTVTATGRLSSSEPNLQNIPIRKAEGREIRRMFVASKDSVLVAADYSQIELRLLAHLSGDEVLIKAFNTGEDIHASTAAKVFGVDITEVDKEMRRRAKAVNFGIIYGISDFGLSTDIGCSVQEAKLFIDKYFDTYPKVKEYLEDAKTFAKEKKYQKTMFDRIRKLPDIASSNYTVRSFNERVAMNMPMQGSASDIIKFAMLNLIKAFENRGISAKLILQVHDELIVDCPCSEVDIVTEVLRDAMQSAAELKVPLLVDINTGTSWYEAK